MIKMNFPWVKFVIFGNTLLVFAILIFLLTTFHIVSELRTQSVIAERCSPSHSKAVIKVTARYRTRHLYQGSFLKFYPLEERSREPLFVPLAIEKLLEQVHDVNKTIDHVDDDSEAMSNHGTRSRIVKQSKLKLYCGIMSFEYDPGPPIRSFMKFTNFRFPPEFNSTPYCTIRDVLQFKKQGYYIPIGAYNCTEHQRMVITYDPPKTKIIK